MKTLNQSNDKQIPTMLPVIPTMDVVVFPNMIVPLLVLDERIIQGINKALATETKTVLLLASRKEAHNHDGTISTQDLYDVGTIATIMRMIKIPEGGVKILVQGVCKAKVEDLITHGEILNVQAEPITFTPDPTEPEITAQIKNIKDITEKMAACGQAISPDFQAILSRMHDPEKIADFILSHLNLSVKDAQELLQTTSYCEFLEKLYGHLAQEIEVAQVQERIKSRTRESMNQAQREYYLREQMKAIRQELGEDDLNDLDAIREKICALEMSEESKKEVLTQVKRLENTSPDSMEAAVLQNYIEWVLALPWNQETEDNLDISHAKEILDEDHAGLDEIKDRILDFISVRSLKKDGHTPILCFVGPPGTGKTSLGASIARCLNRKYMRVSLGGVKDEAEIRGHRRTYVGAMPGRFIQGLRKAQSNNPVIIIDELDKIGSDFRGDPSAAMLEVLDPNQNKTFYDNFMGIPFDLSKALFIATANGLDTISQPLRDRMEIIEVSGYTIEEKCTIAKDYLVKKAIEEAGLEGKHIKFSDEVLQDIAQHYTRESGVRELSRLIKKLCSKEARSFVEKNKIVTITTKNIEKYLGPRRFIDTETDFSDQVGITNGLAWTACGGEVLKIEAVAMPGSGKLTLTGHLGDVMKESAQAALSYARAHMKEFKIKSDMFTKYDLHIHVPAGAVPKDGPSAGITMLSSIISALTKRPINAQYAMTGEINLRGNVMPIGGVKEKVLAAKRNGIKNILLPLKNKHDMINLDHILEGIKVIWVEQAEEVLKHVLNMC